MVGYGSIVPIDNIACLLGDWAWRSVTLHAVSDLSNEKAADNASRSPRHRAESPPSCIRTGPRTCASSAARQPMHRLSCLHPSARPAARCRQRSARSQVTSGYAAASRSSPAQPRHQCDNSEPCTRVPARAQRVRSAARLCSGTGRGGQLRCRASAARICWWREQPGGLPAGAHPQLRHHRACRPRCAPSCFVS